MANLSIKTGTISRSMLVGNSPYSPPAFNSIATTTLSASTGWINFSSIPQTYKHLQIRIMGRCLQGGSAQSDVSCVLNNDQTSSYSWHRVRGNTSTADATGSATQAYANIGFVPTNGYTANIFGVLIVDIYNYTSTTQNKTIKAQGGFEADGSGISGLFSGLWQKTNAVTDLSFSNQNNAYDWTAGTIISLYGIGG
jgi:hypothetical protein